jgi:hypothetical protein
MSKSKMLDMEDDEDDEEVLDREIEQPKICSDTSENCADESWANLGMFGLHWSSEENLVAMAA